jgi:hypothetical protein
MLGELKTGRRGPPRDESLDRLGCGRPRQSRGRGGELLAPGQQLLVALAENRLSILQRPARKPYVRRCPFALRPVTWRRI